MIIMNSGVWAPSRHSINSYNPLINKDKIFSIMAVMGESTAHARDMNGGRGGLG